jgi:hypothetical protein
MRKFLALLPSMTMPVEANQRFLAVSPGASLAVL